VLEIKFPFGAEVKCWVLKVNVLHQVEYLRGVPVNSWQIDKGNFVELELRSDGRFGGGAKPRQLRVDLPRGLSWVE
jgi:hypothetical protein